MARRIHIFYIVNKNLQNIFYAKFGWFSIKLCTLIPCKAYRSTLFKMFIDLFVEAPKLLLQTRLFLP